MPDYIQPEGRSRSVIEAHRTPKRGRLVAWGAVIVASTLLCGLAGVALFVWSGLYDVGATAGHSRLTSAILHYAMKRSVKLHAPRKAPPLDDPRLILRGATHFQTGCAPCHGAPGVLPSIIENGATPPPPPLVGAAYQFRSGELYWIVKHGIKMTAMPAWPAQQRDDEVWAMVAFLEKLPSLDAAGYERLALDSGDQHQPQLKPSLPSLAEPPLGVVASCVSCHGTDGRGRDGAFPNIAGLDRDYVLDTLRAFADGSRPSGFMQAIAARLTDAEKHQATNYFTRLARGNSQAVLRDGKSEAKRALGESIARFGADGVPACLGCHTIDDDARSPGTPALSGQQYDYIVQQMQLFRSGVRAQGPNSAIMARFARRLSNTQIEAVSDYLAALQPQPGIGARLGLH